MAKSAIFSLPEKRGFLAALGAVSVRHAQLDHILRFTIKTFTGVTPSQALLATHRQGSAQLRNRIHDLAKKQLGEGAALVQLQALLSRAEALTERRNELLHRVCAEELDGRAIHFDAHGRVPLPKVKDVKQLATDINTLMGELNKARLEGFIYEALKSKKPKT